MEKPTVLGYIRSQPEVLRETLQRQEEFVAVLRSLFSEHPIKKVLFFGSGTSYNAANIAAYYFKQIVGLEAVAWYPTVYENYEIADWTGNLTKEEILFIGISQSGTSVSTVQVIKKARKEGYLTLALTGNLQSEISKYAEHLALLTVGDELTPPETKGFTVTVLSLYLWALALAHLKDVITAEYYHQQLGNLAAVLAKFEAVITESEAWYQANKEEILNSQCLYVLGYGIDYGSALEGQLKIGEMLRLPTIGFELEEYVHGPTMALNPRHTIFLIGSQEREWERMLLFRQTFKKYTQQVYLLTVNDVEHDKRDLIFSIKADKFVAPLLYAVPLQIVAAQGALDRGIDTGINPFDEALAHYPE